MILVNTDYIGGKELEMLTIVKGSTIQTKHIGKDITQSFKTLVGGELKEYTQMMNEARALATKRMVESELDKLAEALDKVAAENIAPDVKILKLIETHLDAIKMIVRRNGSLRASFFRDIWQVERVRRNLNLHEIALFKQVLIEGNEMGLFEVENVDILADILHYCVKGIEVPYIRGKIGDDLDDRQGWEYVAKIVYGALGHKSVETNS